jgi:hypothetical protein
MTEQIPLIDLEPQPAPELPTEPLHVYLVVAWQPVKSSSSRGVRVVALKSEIAHFEDYTLDGLAYRQAVNHAQGLNVQWTHREIIHVVLGGGK